MENKTEIKEKCRKCGGHLEDAPQNFDALSIFNSFEMKFCNNPNCERYRIVIVATSQGLENL